MKEDDHSITAAELSAALDRVVETVAGEISAFRAETNAHFTTVDRRLERIHERLNLLWTGQATLQNWAERTDTDTAATLADLTRRIEALEKKAS